MFAKKTPAESAKSAVNKVGDHVANAVNSVSKAAQPKKKNPVEKTGTSLMHTAQDAVKTVKKTVGMK
ncbi:hypothetical protein MKX01_002308 [Papaver californicum]|nr:hypothetical protein MKX01_002308 [Papaver californicum]